MIQIISMKSAMAILPIPVAIPKVSASRPTMVGMMMEPRLAVVRMKLQARLYFFMSSPAKETVVAYIPAMEKPKPIIPIMIGRVVFDRISTIKKRTMPTPMAGSRSSFFTFVERKAVVSLPRRIIIQRMLAVT